MRYVDEFNDPALAHRLLDEIHRITTRPWTLMEVCGGQTHAILRHGIDQLLPDQVELLHGPGCPVCVTPVEVLDTAQAIALQPDTVLCTYGDMVRVPASGSDLAAIRSRGGDVRVVRSPLDAVRIARDEPDRQVVFLAVGFETTAPATALAVREADRTGLTNLSFLVAHVLVAPAMEAIVGAPGNRVQAFLAAGHVCAVMGTDAHLPLAERYGIPVVVTGFEAVDLLDGIRRAVLQLEQGRAEVENAYPRAVTPEGNPTARELLDEVFEVCDRDWRGIGELPASGWRLRPAFGQLDAEARFADLSAPSTDAVGGFGGIADPDAAVPACRSGEVLQGLITPDRCEAFGTRCTPHSPLGATMVSDEGTCAAYYAHRRHLIGGVG